MGNGALLSGYYGFGNAGDEAILQGTILALRQKGVRVAVLSHKPEETAKQLGVASFGRKNLNDILKGIRSSSVVLSGGGGLFQDTTSFRSLFYYLKIPMLAKIMGKKTMVFAQGIGPIRSWRGKRLTRVVCNRFMDRITVRDEESKSLLESLGVRKAIEVTADPAFLLPSPSDEEIRSIRSRFSLDPGATSYLGVVLREWGRGTGGMGPALPGIAEGISSFCRAKQLTPVLISFQPGEDDHLMRNLSERLQVKGMLVPDHMSPGERIALSACFELVFGMRYHSVVFSSIAGVPFVGIGYDPKVENFTRSLGFPLLSLHDLSSSGVKNSLSTTFEKKGELRRVLEEVIPLLRKKATLNIDRVMELLEGSPDGQ